jgi:hypothetical protein
MRVICVLAAALLFFCLGFGQAQTENSPEKQMVQVLCYKHGAKERVAKEIQAVLSEAEGILAGADDTLRLLVTDELLDQMGVAASQRAGHRDD